MKRLAMFALGAVFGPFLLQNAFGAPGIPTERIQSILEEVIAIQTNPQLKDFRNEKRAAIKKIIAQSFYFDSMARQALGQHWQALNDSKRSEFKVIFQDLFQESYTRLVLDFLGREKILYKQEEIRQNQARVKTAIFRMNEEISVDYSLVEVEGKWLVEDVAIDGVSIMQNYQKTFSRVIRQESIDGLLKKMRLQQQTIERSS